MKRYYGDESSVETTTQKFINPAALNRQSGDPADITGMRYADIFWDYLFAKKEKEGNKAIEAMEQDSELIHPDDGAKWLRDKLAIRKRIFILEKRMQQDAVYDPKSVLLLRSERDLSVALDAAIAQLKRERDQVFDQLYDAQSEFEAIAADRKVAERHLQKQTDIYDKVMDKTKFAKAKLDATIRRTGQPEEWKTKFLEEEATRRALEQEIVDLQAQVDEIRLDKGDDFEDQAGAREFQRHPS